MSDSVYDPPRGRAATQAELDDALLRVDLNAAREWKHAAVLAMNRVILRREDFTADEVWKELQATAPELRTHNPSALGPIFLRAKKAGLIRSTGRVRRSVFSQRHRDLVIWTCV